MRGKLEEETIATSVEQSQALIASILFYRYTRPTQGQPIVTFTVSYDELEVMIFAMDKPTILIVSTLDTKRDETLFLRSQILSHGSCSVKILDVGRTLQRAEDLQIPESELVPRMPRTADPPADLPRGKMINATIERCIPIIEHLLDSSSIQGIVAAGGSSGSSLATALMRKCPVGFPKLMVRYQSPS